MSEFGKGSETGSSGDRQYEGQQPSQVNPLRGARTIMSPRAIRAIQGFEPEVGEDVKDTKVGETGDKGTEGEGSSYGQEGGSDGKSAT